MPRHTALIVEDFKELSRFVAFTLRQKAEIELIDQAFDGLEGVQRAEQLQPDLVVLDVGLPKLNGIEVARQVRDVSPNSKILFLTQESSPEILQAALNVGAQAYVLKSHMSEELLLAVDAVLQGRHFVGSGLSPSASNESDDNRPANFLRPVAPPLPHRQTSHIAASYPDEASLVSDFVRFIETALKAGNPIIAIATKTHLESIQQRLEASGWDVSAAIEDGSYISLTASDVLSTFMVDGWPQSSRVLNAVADLVNRAVQTAKCEDPRVQACGEMGPTLLAQGNGGAAIQLEHLTNEIAKSCDVDILCGYMVNDIQAGENRQIFERICAEHSAVYSQ